MQASQATATAAVQNTCYLNHVYLPAPAVITTIRIRCSTGGNGHYDVGIYDSLGTNSGPLNLLAHAAATATSLATASATVEAPSFINGNLSLSAGNYWLAFWCDNATDTWNKMASASALTTVLMSGTTTGPLPALATSLTSLNSTTTGLTFSLIALVSGGWQ